MIAPPLFIGFRPKKIAGASHEWLGWMDGRVAVQEICSVSDCISDAPPDWTERWDFNPAWCYNSEPQALAAIPPGEEGQYTLFGYRMFPVRFEKNGRVPIDLLREFEAASGEFPAEPDLNAYGAIGYDLAGGPVMFYQGEPCRMLGFSCSPLSCNGCAAEINVNRYCLIDDLSAAIAAGEHFGRTEPEPGPFYLYQVLRKKQPMK